MAEQRRAGDGDDTRERRGAGKALKRRGILAAAGAVVAGMVAKQTAQPVLAAPLTGDSVVAATPGVTGTNSAAGGTGVSGDADAAGVHGSAHGAGSKGVDGSSNGGTASASTASRMAGAASA